MVKTEILDESLRGGEAARLLEERCRHHLLEAEKAVKDAVATAPEFLKETREKHNILVDDSEGLTTQLDMLGESLDEITQNSTMMLERSRKEVQKKSALDELSKALVPFVHVAQALEKSDHVSDVSIPDLDAILAVLQDAIKTAEDSGRQQLGRVVPELQERIEQVKVTMRSRFLSTYEILPNTVKAFESSSSGREDPESACNALAEAGLLEDVIEGIVEELIRKNVAVCLSKATMCFENEEYGHSLEWHDCDNDFGELLEFDFDDIEAASEEEVEAMSENLDISNTAARALKIYDLLRKKVVGEAYSRELAFAMQSWFCNQVLPSSAVLSSNRVNQAGNHTPGTPLNSRVAAVSACASVIQAAVRSRGVNSFVLILEMDSLESKVGSECRAQAMLKTRRAISSFANARHENDDIVTCPLSADTYIAPDDRPTGYFAPCLVTKTALVVHDVFLATRRDADIALQGGSHGISAAMNGAAIECLRAYREDIPVQHGDELRASLRLKALYYTDCSMLAHSCRLSLGNTSQASEMQKEAKALEGAAQKAMAVVRRTAERRLLENLNAACRNGALGAYGTLTRIQRSSALSAAYHGIREVVSVFAQIVPTELAEVAACRLLEKYLTTLTSEVVSLPEISADACAQIDSILQEAEVNVTNVMEMVAGMEMVRAGAPPPAPVEHMRKCVKRVQVIREILNARMEDICTNFRSGKYGTLITRDEVERFILAIFEDSSLRASFIFDLDRSINQETGGWENDNW